MEYKKIGNENKIAFEYALKDTSSGNEKKDSWGSIRLWVNQINTCKFEYKGQIFEHEGYLSWLVEWLCENLEYIIGYDDYPLPIQEEDMNKIWGKVFEFESDDLEEDLWFSANSRWTFRHTWLNARGGSILPSVCFRRIGDTIEISWDNEFYKKDQIVFLSEKESYKIDRMEFIKVTVKFLRLIISDFKEKNMELLDWIQKLERILNLYEMI